MIETGARGRSRPKYTGRKKPDGYSTDAKERQRQQEDEDVDYDDLNDQFGNVSVSGKCTVAPKFTVFLAGRRGGGDR